MAELRQIRIASILIVLGYLQMLAEFRQTLQVSHQIINQSQTLINKHPQTPVTSQSTQVDLSLMLAT